MSSTGTEKRDKLPGLEGLRALATIGIFLFHSGFLLQGTFPVTLFFMLSGFLMYYTKSEQIERTSFVEWVHGYVRYKVRQFYPLHFITFLIACVVGRVLSKISADMLIGAALDLMLIHPFFPKYALIFNGLAWFLAVIIFLYIVAYPLQKALNRMKNAVVPALLTILAIILLNLLNRFGFELYLYTNPFYRILDFLLGMLIAKMYVDKKYAIRKSNCVELFLVAVFVIQYIASLFISGDPGYYSILFAVSLYVFAVGEGCVSTLLKSRFLAKIASYSFEFYMIHELALRVFRKVFSESIFYPIRLILITLPALAVSIAFAVCYKSICKRIKHA